MKNSIIKQIRERKEEKKYKKLLQEVTDFINNEVDNENGFDVPYKRDEETGAISVKWVTPSNFEHAFHMDIWNNMTIPEQILALIWFERAKAKEQNRPSMRFILDPYKVAYEYELEEFTLKLVLPTYIFETNQKSSYEHMHIISKMGILLRDAHYKAHFFAHGKNKGNFDEVYMSVADTIVNQPDSYKKIVVQAYDKNELKPEDIEANKPYFKPLTQEEKEDNLLFLLQPRQYVWWQEYKKIETIGDRNDYYMGEDYNFEQYKKIVGINKAACDKFIEENTKEIDKNELFFELLETASVEEVEIER